MRGYLASLVQHVFGTLTLALSRRGRENEEGHFAQSQNLCRTVLTVPGDETRLGQVLQNLIGNALKFCKEAPRIHITAQHEDHHWRFSVRDNGTILIRNRPSDSFRYFNAYTLIVSIRAPASGWRSARRSSNVTAGVSG